MANSKYSSIIPTLNMQPSKVVSFTKFTKSEYWYKSAARSHNFAYESFPDPNLFDDDYVKTKMVITPIVYENQKLAVSEKMPKSTATEFKISHKANLNIRNRINWLFQLSNPKQKMSTNGKIIKDFRLSFITLTLPSTQRHPTAVITEQCLNQWLIEMRRDRLFQNYVWRLEFQKNGNVHYHIVTDTYIQWHHARNLWNRITQKLGYVTEYQNTFKDMSFQQYCVHNGTSSRQTLEVMRKRYDVGTSEHWQNPNSIDVKNIDSKNNIAAYISKYVSKQNASSGQRNELDTDENSKNIRLWFCSQSLSKLRAASFALDTFDFNIIEYIKTSSKTFHVIHDFCECLYYDVNTVLPELGQFLSILFSEHSQKTNYVPSD